MALKIAIAGVRGRMGRALLTAAADTEDIRVTGASETPGADAPLPAGPPVAADPARAAAGADVWIDFTTPEATLAALAVLPGCGVRAAVVGTTGFDAAGEAAILAAASDLAIVRSGNFSPGLNLLARLVRQAAAALGPQWDIEVSEAHHRAKVDAPSGTALMLAEAAAQGRGAPLDLLRLPPHDGLTGARAEGGIGLSVVRAGGIVGAHQVLFGAAREVLTLSHSALDRAVFAHGALSAARWVAGRPPGLYDMGDVLGLAD